MSKFDESKIKRDKDGQFASKGESSGSSVDLQSEVKSILKKRILKNSIDLFHKNKLELGKQRYGSGKN